MSKMRRKWIPLHVKLACFRRDGFIDRIDGKRLWALPYLRMRWLQEGRPWSSNDWTDPEQQAIATLEHLDALSPRRPDLFEPGAETMENYLTISWKNNLARSNRSLEAMGWTVRPKRDDPSPWDGGMREFLAWAADPAIRRTHRWAADWFNAARKETEMRDLAWGPRHVSRVPL